jgi:hypothetical protein
LEKKRYTAPKRLIKEQLKGWLAVQGALAFENLRALSRLFASGNSTNCANL